MYCPHCGANLGDNTLNFCPNCGSQISNTDEPQKTIISTASVQTIEKNIGSSDSHSQKCLGFAIASLVMGIATFAIGFILIIILRIVGSIILLIIHVVGLNLGISARKHCKIAAELEPSNPSEKAGSVIVIFGIVVNTILLVVDIIFIIIFLIILSI